MMPYAKGSFVDQIAQSLTSRHDVDPNRYHIPKLAQDISRKTLRFTLEQVNDWLKEHLHQVLPEHDERRFCDHTDADGNKGRLSVTYYGVTPSRKDNRPGSINYETVPGLFEVRAYETLVTISLDGKVTVNRLERVCNADAYGERDDDGWNNATAFVSMDELWAGKLTGPVDVSAVRADIDRALIKAGHLPLTFVVTSHWLENCQKTPYLQSLAAKAFDLAHRQALDAPVNPELAGLVAYFDAEKKKAQEYEAIQDQLDSEYEEIEEDDDDLSEKPLPEGVVCRRCWSKNACIC